MQAQPQDLTTVIYRVTTVEQQIIHLQDQLKTYVPVRENDLQLRNIQDSVNRIERDVIDIKTRLETQEKELIRRDEQQRDAQNKLQIRTLIWIVVFILTSAVTIFTGYITHFFH